MAFPPGWYVDQADAAYEIYWDGSEWTNARRLVIADPGKISASPTPSDSSADSGGTEPPASKVRWRRDEPAVPSATYPPAPTVRRSRPWAIPLGTGLAGILVGMIIGGLGVAGISAVNEKGEKAAAVASAKAEEAALGGIFPAAVANCSADTAFAVISDGNRTLTIDNEGEEDYMGLSYTDLWCILEELKTPTAVISHIEQTTSLDGRQTESWGNIEASWSYHPDRGMDAVFTIIP